MDLLQPSWRKLLAVNIGEWSGSLMGSLQSHFFIADDHISAGKEATVASRIPESYTVPSMFYVNYGLFQRKYKKIVTHA